MTTIDSGKKDLLLSELKDYQDFLLNTRVKEAVMSIYSTIAKQSEMVSGTWDRKSALSAKCLFGIQPQDEGYIITLKKDSDILCDTASLIAPVKLVSNLRSFDLALAGDSFEWNEDGNELAMTVGDSESWEKTVAQKGETLATLVYLKSMTQHFPSIKKAFNKIERNFWRYNQVGQVVSQLENKDSSPECIIEGCQALSETILEKDHSYFATKVLRTLTLLLRSMVDRLSRSFNVTNTKESSSTASTRVEEANNQNSNLTFFNNELEDPASPSIKLQKSSSFDNRSFFSAPKQAEKMNRSKSEGDLEKLTASTQKAKTCRLFDFERHASIAQKLVGLAASA